VPGMPGVYLGLSGQYQGQSPCKEVQLYGQNFRNSSGSRHDIKRRVLARDVLDDTIFDKILAQT
jgi:hypothetical protein